MASRDPTELKEELEDVDFEGDTEQLVELRSEARETVDAQRETLNDIDTKASKILRLNVALIGILISVLSIAIQVGPESETGLGNVEPFVNVYMEIGLGALVLSTAFAAMTYTASELDVGVSSDNLTNLLKAGFTRDETEELLVKNYITRINFNRSTNVRNIPLIQLTIVLIVTAIVSFVLGLYQAVSGSVPVWLWLPSIGLLGGVIWVSGLIKQIRRAIDDLREWR